MEFTCFYLFVIVIVETVCQQLSNDISGGKGPNIVSLTVRTDIVYRYAETVVTSTVVNDDVTSRETTFDVNLPQSAFISNFTLEIDGIIYPAIVEEKEAALKTYEKAKSKGKTAGHVSTKPRHANKFRVNINVSPQAEVTFVLTYAELLQRKRGQYEHVVYIDPKQVVDQLLVEVFIFESREITALRTPPVGNDIMDNVFEITTSNELATVERPSPKTAYIRYNPTPEEQKKFSVQGISGLFKVQYDVQRSLDAGDLFLINGYFTHFFAPSGIPPMRKRISFVLDVSGSMSLQRKLDQVKEAMTQILSELQAEDWFNIVLFDSTISHWKPEMQLATEENVRDATHMVQGLNALGGTNIHESLTAALSMLQEFSKGDNLDSGIIVFLTDGEATVGLTDPTEILNSIESQNAQKVQIFSLAFGHAANYDFLKKMSARNNAFARKIYTDSDAALQLTNFYNEISNVLLSKVSFTYLDDKVNLTSVTKTQFPSYFDGSELIVAGRLNEHHPDFNSLTLSIVGNTPDGVLELTSSTNSIETDLDQIPEFRHDFDFGAITEKTWAYLTIKKLLEEMLRTENRLIKKEIKSQAIRLAIKYNFVTPVTSMVVVKPDKDPEMPNKNDPDIQDDDANAVDAGNQNAAAQAGVSLLKGLSGKSTSVPLKGYADNDPHFIVNFKDLEYAVCFDVMGEEGDLYRLINDTYSDLTVTATVVSNKQIPAEPDANTTYTHTSGEIKTFLGEITIKRSRFTLTVTPLIIRLNRETIEWQNGTMLSHGKTRIVVGQAGSMIVIMFNDRVAFLIMRHLRTPAQLKTGKVNFVGFYIVDYKGLSYHTHGLLGQFLHRSVILKKTKTRKGKLMGRLRINGNTPRPRKVMATLGHRLNLATNETVSCWMIQHNGGALLDGDIRDYLVKRKKGLDEMDSEDGLD